MRLTALEEAFWYDKTGQFFTLSRAVPLLADGASVVLTVGSARHAALRA